MKKTGFIAIIGRANVGKSTILNALLGEKIAIVSNKPQTTRNRITGILTKDDCQFVFMDTPGMMYKAKNKLGSYMIKSVTRTFSDVDAVILVVEAEFSPGEIEKGLIERIKQTELPAILVINKIDKTNAAGVAKAIKEYSELHDFEAVIPVSALKQDGISIILDEASKLLHECDEFLFPEDYITDQPERQIAAEIIREKILRLTDDEVPHGTAVVIEEFKEGRDIINIRAEIFCEKDSHKRIIIGKNGEMLKKIGTYSREDMEAFFGIKIYLNLWVKVKENWRDSDFYINNFGLKNDDLT